MSLAFYPPLVTPTMALNMRQNAGRGTNGTCPVCGTGFSKKRVWHVFCSPKCRKRAWLLRRQTATYTDVRNDIAAIKADVAWMKEHFGKMHCF